MIAVRWDVHLFTRLDNSRKAHGKAEVVSNVARPIVDHGIIFRTPISTVMAFECEE